MNEMNTEKCDHEKYRMCKTYFIHTYITYLYDIK